MSNVLKNAEILHNKMTFLRDISKPLIDECKEKFGAMCSPSSGAEREMTYTNSNSPKCKNADIIIGGDTKDAVYIPDIYENICSGRTSVLGEYNLRCKVLTTKRLGSACIADSSIMNQARRAFGVPIVRVEPKVEGAKSDIQPKSVSKNKPLSKKNIKERTRKALKQLKSKRDSNGVPIFAGLKEGNVGEIINEMIRLTGKGYSVEEVVSKVAIFVGILKERAMMDDMKEGMEDHEKSIETLQKKGTAPADAHKRMKNKLDR